MEITKITETFSVSPQISADDMVDIKKAGFRAILCNRPDGEETDQPRFGEIEEAAEKAGLLAVYLPVAKEGVTDENVAKLGAILKDMPRPILAYCRSGARSSMLWSQHKAQ